VSNIVVAVSIIVVVGLVAQLARRRQVSDVPTQKVFTVPSQIDRADFNSTEVSEGHPEWLIVVFTSASCHVCADVWDKVQVMATSQVGIFKADYETDRVLHERYGIDAVPTLIICDGAGVVQGHFLGPVSATDLWAAVATVRDPSTKPDGSEHPAICFQSDVELTIGLGAV
jgi:thioredoxin-like negative regulator of GroEL